MKKTKFNKKVIEESPIKTPIKDPNENGKVIFNKFDLIKDPLEAEKERQKVRNLKILLFFLKNFKKNNFKEFCNSLYLQQRLTIVIYILQLQFCKILKKNENLKK